MLYIFDELNKKSLIKRDTIKRNESHPQFPIKTMSKKENCLIFRESTIASSGHLRYQDNFHVRSLTYPFPYFLSNVVQLQLETLTSSCRLLYLFIHSHSMRRLTKIPTSNFSNFYPITKPLFSKSQEKSTL